MQLFDALNPARIPGRLTLISRMGADHVETKLRPLLRAVFVSAGGELRPDLYVDAARPAVLVGAAVLAAAMVAALSLPSGRSSTTAAIEAAPDAEATASDSPALVEA